MEVTILGKVYAVRPPVQFSPKEALLVAISETAGMTFQRQIAQAAVVGMCTKLGTEIGADFVKARFDALAYGNAVYSHLRTHGMKMEELPEIAGPIIAELSRQVFPREAEVQSEADFSNPTTESATARP